MQLHISSVKFYCADAHLSTFCKTKRAAASATTLLLFLFCFLSKKLIIKDILLHIEYDGKEDSKVSLMTDPNVVMLYSRLIQNLHDN